MSAPAIGPLSLLVVQATPYCNLDCDYCYLPDRHDRRRLEPALLDPILDTVLASPFVEDSFTLLWHAGEPLMVPPAFYDEASTASLPPWSAMAAPICRSPRPFKRMPR